MTRDTPPPGKRPAAVYLAARGFERELADELEMRQPGCVTERRERLFVSSAPPIPAAWAQNIWLEPFFLPIASVGDAARQLRGIQRNWHCHPVDLYRRTALIAEHLPPVKARPLAFGENVPVSPLGAWTLWERDLLLLSARCSSPFPDGEVRFEEDRFNPPSRAYLKLWEAFTLLGERPAPGELCLDLGASPGGWSWVLGTLGAHVFAVDKAPLAPGVMNMRGVDWCRGSSFSLSPDMTGTVDWLFSDMACYPGRLLDLVRLWHEHGAARRFLCTLKFQGETDHASARAFAAFPGSRLLHLSCNRHELTWFFNPTSC
ncbi:MAG TPA: hypothetical protein H9991_00205 [Candidatus Mailhella excrementigallinarum]|nr:MAG: hypothetical protein DBY37_03150 [Desulfovibrionaceae bacterium]HIV64660.1 hypothetical protein [Candidatus Mailhella excrementigallinarum]